MKNNKKLTFEKSITRDWALIYGDIWHEAFTKKFKKQLGWGIVKLFLKGKKIQ